MPHGTSLQCGACKTARINHERWTQRHPEHAAIDGLPLSTADRRVAEAQALKAYLRSPQGELE
jgi:hypothetical protein